MEQKKGGPFTRGCGGGGQILHLFEKGRCFKHKFYILFEIMGVWVFLEARREWNRMRGPLPFLFKPPKKKAIILKRTSQSMGRDQEKKGLFADLGFCDLVFFYEGEIFFSGYFFFFKIFFLTKLFFCTCICDDIFSSGFFSSQQNWKTRVVL